MTLLHAGFPAGIVSRLRRVSLERWGLAIDFFIASPLLPVASISRGCSKIYNGVFVELG
jgi:hypothetical protein